tara:strand:- start:119 stop:373 length:255 start_codon:yes stop_codon:yes gene_type:complete
LDEDLRPFALDAPHWVSPPFGRPFVGYIVDESSNVLGEREHTSWAECLTSPALAYFPNESFDVLPCDVQMVIYAVPVEIVNKEG